LERDELLYNYFSGRTDTYALQQRDGTYRNIKEPVTPTLYKSHCQGKLTLSIYPTSLGACQVAVIDIDSLTPQAQDRLLFIKRWLAQKEIPSFIEPSGRRGYHLWLVLKKWLPVKKVHRLLKAAVDEAEEELGKPSYLIEIFPTPAPGLGKCVKLPFGKHQVTGNFTKFVDERFIPYPDWGVGVIDSSLPISEDQLDWVIADLPEEVPAKAPQRGLPCFSRMMEGVDEGFRHIASFRLPVMLYRQGMDQELAKFTLLKWNLERNRPPLEEKQIGYNIRDAYTGKYGLGCPDIEAAGFCSPDCPVWSKRFNEIDEKVQTETFKIERLMKVTSSPPTYKVIIDSQEVQLSSDDLLLLRNFKKKVAMQLNIIPYIGLTQKGWEKILSSLLSAVEMDEAPPDASDEMRYIDAIYSWIEKTPKAEEPADIEAGKPLEDEEYYYFRSKDILRALELEYRLKPKPHELWAIVRCHGGQIWPKRVRDRIFKLWRLPKRKEEEVTPGETEEVTPGEGPPEWF